MSDMLHLLVLMVTVWTFGRVFKKFLNLPEVFGELLGGIIVGPALLGLVDPHNEAIIVLAELGIFFLMMHSGLKTDHKELLECSKQSIVIAIGSMILPLIGGYFVSRMFGQSTAASLCIAVSLTISSIVLVARLFKDSRIENTRVAHLTMGAAVITDIIGLILFSVVLNIAETGDVQIADIFLLILKVSAFFGVIFFVGLKSSGVMQKLLAHGNKGFTLTLIIALAIGLIAEAIGLHMIIGAFLAGLFIREEFVDQKVFDKIEDRYYGLSYSFFGPIFFASLAFHLDLTAFFAAPLFLGAIILVAIFGKVIGAGGAALLTKSSGEESLMVGLAMNSRGAVELIIASIALELAIIDRTAFSVLIIMAFVTTVISILGSVPVAKRLQAH